MPGGRVNVRYISAASVKRKLSFINFVQRGERNSPAHVHFQQFSFVFVLTRLFFAGRCGREQELCGCLLSMLLFSVNKVVFKVCLDFGRSVIFRTPCVNMFSRVKENCIAVVTRLNMADGNKTANTRRLQIQSEDGFIPASRAKKKKRKEKKTSSRNNSAM